MRVVARFAAVLASGVITFACGGPREEAKAPPPAVSDADAGALFAEVHPDDLAELHGDAGAGEAPSDTPAPAAATTAEPVDECAPVGSDFEKRARPKIKECYRDGKAKEPDLKGSIRIAFDIDHQGKTKGPKIVETTLPKAVSQCMLKAVKDTPLEQAEAAKCPNKTVTIPVTFPTPP